MKLKHKKQKMLQEVPYDKLRVGSVYLRTWSKESIFFKVDAIIRDHVAVSVTLLDSNFSLWHPDNHRAGGEKAVISTSEIMTFYKVPRYDATFLLMGCRIGKEIVRKYHVGSWEVL